MLFRSVVVLTLVTLNVATDPEVEHLKAEVTSLKQLIEGKFLGFQNNVSSVEQMETIFGCRN